MSKVSEIRSEAGREQAMRRARVEYVMDGSVLSGTVTFPGRPAQTFHGASELERCLGRGAGRLVLVDNPPDTQEAAGDLTALSPTEQEIARRAVEGASNREIADALFYSVKSVEAYLTRIYRRLGIEGREGLSSIDDIEDLAPLEADCELVAGGSSGSAGCDSSGLGPQHQAVVIELFVA